MKKSTALSIILYALPFSSVILQIQVYHTEENYSRRKRLFYAFGEFVVISVAIALVSGFYSIFDTVL